ncbi:MAG: metal-dependent hydrolase [Gemmatimonadota bacterium]
MASIGHLAVGAALGAAYSIKSGSRPRPTIIAFALLALAPDLDLTTALFGVPRGTGSPLDHRGFTHSVFFALAIGGIVGALVKGSPMRRYFTGLWAFVALASHGLLDTMSRLGNGPMLFWPFSNAFYEFPLRPIPGVLTAQHYLTVQAIPTLVVETMLFLPFIAYAIGVFFPGGYVENRVPAKVLPEA